MLNVISVPDVRLNERVVWNSAFERIAQIVFVERGLSCGRNRVAVQVALPRDGRLKPVLFDPVDCFFRANVRCLSQGLQRKTVAADLANVQLSSVESVSKSLWAYV